MLESLVKGFEDLEVWSAFTPLQVVLFDEFAKRYCAATNMSFHCARCSYTNRNTGREQQRSDVSNLDPISRYVDVFSMPAT